LTLQADGLKAAAVPVSLQVLDYRLSDPAQYRTWIELI
jgi:hypothetical protein